MSDPERDLDETLEETFPASDAPANTVETGVRLDGEPETTDIVDNREASRFEMTVDGHLAFLQYKRTPISLVLVHTEVPPPFRNRGLGTRLVEHGIRQAAIERVRMVPLCKFVKAYVQKHPGDTRG
jgi:predicted GNAT family acetyltransferase